MTEEMPINPMSEETINEFRRSLGMGEMPNKAYIYAPVMDKCLLIENQRYDLLRKYEVVKDAWRRSGTPKLYDGDLILVDGTYMIESDLVFMCAGQFKQLRLIGTDIYEVKPVQP